VESRRQQASYILLKKVEDTALYQIAKEFYTSLKASDAKSLASKEDTNF